MKRTLVGVVVALLVSVSPSFAQTCASGQPPAPWPGPGFVPTADCRGWVPANHPLAMPPNAPSPIPGPTGEMPPASLVAQSIYTALDGLSPQISASAGGVRQFAGWAVDCALGTLPPVLKIMETKPDGSTREVPADYFFAPGVSRPDVQNAIGGACPAVYNAPQSTGGSYGPNDLFGWSVLLRSPITELGVHTFTAVWSWPAKNHSGSSSVSVTIVP